MRINGTLVGFLVGGLVYAAAARDIRPCQLLNVGADECRMMRLSVLDQSTVVTGRSPDASIRESLALARHCEALGYHRYWVAEHHNSDSQAGTAPEILIAAIAATTPRIRVGSAGVMLPHYSALKVAEQFRVLEAIAPGRIDLGLGRAPGSDGLTALCAQPERRARRPTISRPQVRDLLAWLAGEQLVEGHPFRDMRAQPQGPTMPEVWILGSSDYGAQVAAHFGLPYLLRPFHHRRRAAPRRRWRSIARASGRARAIPAPHAALCVWAMAAETEAEADRLFSSRELWRLGRDRGVYARCRRRPRRLPIAYSDAERSADRSDARNCAVRHAGPRAARCCGIWRPGTE